MTLPGGTSIWSVAATSARNPFLDTPENSGMLPSRRTNAAGIRAIAAGSVPQPPDRREADLVDGEQLVQPGQLPDVPVHAADLDGALEHLAGDLPASPGHVVGPPEPQGNRGQLDQRVGV